MLYWDDVNGKVTNDSKYTPIYSGAERIYKETWWVTKGKTCIDFTYSQTSKDLGIVGRERNEHFKKHEVNPNDLRSITIPKSLYDEIEKEWNENH